MTIGEMPRTGVRSDELNDLYFKCWLYVQHTCCFTYEFLLEDTNKPSNTENTIPSTYL